jgi:Flp pilus assembly pilin Flp
MKVIKQFLRDETGMEFSEYVVAATLITLAVIAIFTEVGTAIKIRIDTLTGYVGFS